MKRRPSWSILAGLVLAACSGGSGGFVGKWDSTFGGVSLDIKGDHTVAISVVGIPSEGTWEAQGKDKIVIHGPKEDMTLTKDENGDLSAGMGGRFVKQK
jgi:hypothetical protein